MTDRIRITTREAGWLKSRSTMTPPSRSWCAWIRLRRAGISIAEMVLIRSPGVTADNLRSIPGGPDRGVRQRARAGRCPSRTRCSGGNECRRPYSDRQPGGRSPCRHSADSGSAQAQQPVVLRSRVRNLRMHPRASPCRTRSTGGGPHLQRPRGRIIATRGGTCTRPTPHREKPHQRWIKEARRRGFLAAGERQSRRQS